MAGYGVGGAAASGLQAGFDMGLRADDAAERRRIATVAENRQAMLDTERQAQTERTNARVDKIDAQAEEDRALEALNKEREDLALEGAGLSAQYGGPDKIPGELGSGYARRASEISTRRAALLAKRYAPVVEKEQQWAKDTASRIQAGQQSIEDLTPTETVRLLQAIRKAPVGDLLRPKEGGNSKVGQARDDVVAGIETQNQGLLLQGAGVLLDPDLQEGVGHAAPDGSEIVRKELYGLVPAMPGPGGLRAPGAAPQSLAATLNAVLNPNPAPQGQAQEPPPKLMPVLRVTARHPDGTEVSYHAPVTKGRGTGAGDAVHPGFDLSAAMDRLGQLGALEAWANTPAARAKIEAGLKELGAESNSFLGAYYAMKGNPNSLLPPGETDPVSKKIAAVMKLAKEQFGGDFKKAMLAYEGRTELGPLAKKLADIEASGLSPEDKATATRVAALGVKGAGVGGVGKGSSGDTGSSPALGGIEAPGVGTEAVDFWARAVIAGDRDWQVGLARSKSGSQMIEAVKRRVPELAKEMGLQPQDIGTVRAQKAALDKTLKELTVRSEAIELFASKVEKDMKTFDALLDKASVGAPTILSRPINVLRREFSSPELAQLDLAAKQVATEYERLITGGALSIAQLHVGAQEDARKLINGDMTPKQARAVMETMNAEMKNAREAAHESRKRVSDQMRSLGTGAPDTGGAAPAPAAGKPAPPAVGTVKGGYRFKGGNPADKANWERV